MGSLSQGRTLLKSMMQPATAGMIDCTGHIRPLWRCCCSFDTDMIVTLSDKLMAWLLRGCGVLLRFGDMNILVVLELLYPNEHNLFPRFESLSDKDCARSAPHYLHVSQMRIRILYNIDNRLTIGIEHSQTG